MWKKIGSKLPLIFVVLVAAYGLTGCSKSSTGSSNRAALASKAQQARAAGGTTLDPAQLVFSLMSDVQSVNDHGVYFVLSADGTTVTIDPSDADNDLEGQLAAETQLSKDISAYLSSLGNSGATSGGSGLLAQAVQQLSDDMEDIQDEIAMNGN